MDGESVGRGPASPTRREVLLTMGGGASLGLAGCSSGGRTEERVPAGSLRFANEHDLPHAIGLRVTGVAPVDGDGPVEVPDEQRTLSSTSALDPGETHLYRGVFTEPVRYDLAFTLDGRPPADSATTAFAPHEPGQAEDTSLRLVVGEEGRFLLFDTPDP
jgi:hypothetical protein